jgi:hypothetical protein
MIYSPHRFDSHQPSPYLSFFTTHTPFAHHSLIETHENIILYETQILLHVPFLSFNSTNTIVVAIVHPKWDHCHPTFIKIHNKDPTI